MRLTRFRVWPERRRDPACQPYRQRDWDEKTHEDKAHDQEPVTGCSMSASAGEIRIRRQRKSAEEKRA